MFSKQPVKLFFIKLWGPGLRSVAGLGAVAGLLLFKLGSLIPVYSSNEQQYLATAKHFRAIVNNPLQAPYKLADYLLLRLHHNTLFTDRSVSVLFALIAVSLFYYILLRWHNLTVAILGTALLVTSSWFLHSARQSTPDILLLLLLASLAYGTWIRLTKHSALAMLFAAVIAVGLVYIPGLVWFAVIGGIWQRRAIIGHIKKAKISFPAFSVLALALLLPLIVALGRHPALIKPWLGFPAKLPNPYDYFRHVLNVPYQIFLRGPADPTMWLGRLPRLDIFASAMAVLGALAYYRRHLRLDRSRILTGWLVIGTLLAGLHGTVSILILLA